MARLFLYPTLIVLAIAVTTLALDASRLNAIASAELGLDRSTELAWKSILERLSFSLYSGASDTKANVFALYATAERYDEIAVYATVAFFILTIMFLAYRLYRQGLGAETTNSLAADLIALASICLCTGLIAPMLALKAYADLPVLGEVVFKYQAKSVITTTTTLFNTGAFVIAAVLLLFSIVVPVLKLLISIVIIQQRWPRCHKFGLRFVKAIGKWSMTDVFVVAVLIAYFALSSDEFSDARVRPGLYFFTAYCVLSQIASSRLIIASDSTSVKPNDPGEEQT